PAVVTVSPTPPLLTSSGEPVIVWAAVEVTSAATTTATAPVPPEGDSVMVCPAEPTAYDLVPVIPSNEICPTVTGADRVTDAEEVRPLPKRAVLPAELGTCCGFQLVGSFQGPLPVRFQLETWAGAEGQNVRSARAASAAAGA